MWSFKVKKNNLDRSCAFYAWNKVWFSDGDNLFLLQDEAANLGPMLQWKKNSYLNRLRIVEKNSRFTPAFALKRNQFVWLLTGFSRSLNRVVSVPILMNIQKNCCVWRVLQTSEGTRLPKAIEIRCVARSGNRFVLWGEYQADVHTDDFISIESYYLIDERKNRIEEVQDKPRGFRKLNSKCLLATWSEMVIDPIRVSYPPKRVHPDYKDSCGAQPTKGKGLHLDSYTGVVHVALERRGD